MERPAVDYKKRTWSPLLLLPGALAVAAGVGVFLSQEFADIRFELPSPDYYETSAQVIAALLIALAVEGRADDFLRGPHAWVYKAQLFAFMLGGAGFAFLGASGALGGQDDADKTGLVAATPLLSNLIAAGTTAGLVGGTVAVTMIALVDRPWLTTIRELEPLDSEHEPASAHSETTTAVQFLNTTDTDLRLAWLDFEGHRSREQDVPLKAGEAVEIAGTYAGHAWVVHLCGGPCVAVYVAGAKPARATIRQHQLDQVRAARRSA